MGGGASSRADAPATAVQSRRAVCVGSGATAGPLASGDSLSGGAAPSTSTPGTSPARASSPADLSPDEASGMLSRDEQIAQWGQRLAAAEQQFQQSAGVCREVCRANAGICSAARELCALTGDRAGAPPTDPRCARARASCERAATQREDACPSCPDPA